MRSKGLIRSRRSAVQAAGRYFVLVLFLLLVVGVAQAQDEGTPEGPEIPPVEVLKEEAVPGGTNVVIQIPVSKDSYISSSQHKLWRSEHDADWLCGG